MILEEAIQKIWDRYIERYNLVWGPIEFWDAKTEFRRDYFFLGDKLGNKVQEDYLVAIDEAEKLMKENLALALTSKFSYIRNYANLLILYSKKKK